MTATQAQGASRLTKDEADAALVPILTKANVRIGALRADLRDLCFLNPLILPFLKDGGLATFHFVLLCLAARYYPEGGQCSLTHLASRIPSAGRRRLLAEAWGKELGSPRLLARIHPHLGGAKIYLSLARLLANPDSRRRLGELSTISREAIVRFAEALDAGVRLFNPVLLERYGAHQLKFLCVGLARLRRDLTAEAIAVQIDKATSTDGVDRVIGRLMLAMPFPQPPWPGTSTIRPIASARALRDAGLLMRNCLNRPIMWAEVLKQTTAYYWCDGGHIPYIAALNRSRLFDLWYLQDIYGRNNTFPSSTDAAGIVDAFVNAGFHSLLTGGPLSLMVEN